MHKLRSLFILLSAFLVAQEAFAQRGQQIVDEEYEIENVFGFVKATNGGFISALYYRHSRKLNDRTLTNLGIEMANIRHPRETKQSSFTGSTFVYGKSNYLIAVRPTYGREKIFFRKAPQQGARVTGLIAAGPSFGLEIPYYVELGNGRKEQYDPTNQEHARPFISGSAGPFNGIGEMKVVLGLHAKASLTYETNSTKKKVFGFEVGFTVDAYVREIEIIPLVENQSVYPAAFLAIYFGRRK